ncbi:hypothetical protein [Bradyrhizobium sp. DOA1]|uniref:hypothetical protein n=1 Tax=Bradyrhizobium sp. DOA1 TaxID=1126616 RepID=UPI00077C25FE|nr:hypothetical protein [Bradyrhizobium sp. DOA1]KYG98031.1 hypothetical protein SE91_05330 [Bradyrhizobium sp. DOA1]
MTTFALISEGITDQIILERMILQICSEIFEEDLDINPLQPLRDATDSATNAPHGGWELVLEYCEERVADALASNDYVVIHLDTDEGDHPNFGLRLTEQGNERSYDHLIADAIEIVAARIGNDIYKAHTERLLFAISVHTMESWLLLYFFKRNEPKNSINRLNRLLAKADHPPLQKRPRRTNNFLRKLGARNCWLSKIGNTVSACLLAD